MSSGAVFHPRSVFDCPGAQKRPLEAEIEEKPPTIKSRQESYDVGVLKCSSAVWRFL